MLPYFQQPDMAAGSRDLDMLRVTDARYLGLTPAQWGAALIMAALPCVAIRSSETAPGSLWRGHPRHCVRLSGRFLRRTPHSASRVTSLDETGDPAANDIGIHFVADSCQRVLGHLLADS